ncbi:MAG: hypothetical protein HUK06_10250, partial [Bacteroidaceae bacterium]|nr:hypothetical protein [Bacteroidaceae bacterium]
MNRIFAFIISLFFFISSFAQDIYIVSPLTHDGSVGAASVPVDNNGNPCAMIIVDVPLEDVVIEGA